MDREAEMPSIIPENDRLIYRQAGYGGIAPLGRRPALVVIDVTYGFVGDRPEPILESIKRFPNSCGETGWREMTHIRRLLEAARKRSVPIFYTTGPTRDVEVRAGGWAEKTPQILRASPEQVRFQNRIPKEIAPKKGDTVIEKDKPSAFFGTALTSYLVRKGIDTVLLTGCTTSGCVRATCIDAFSYNYRVGVVRECVFDRAESSHQVNLFEMHAKYAQVVGLDEALTYLAELPPA